MLAQYFLAAAFGHFDCFLVDVELAAMRCRSRSRLRCNELCKLGFFLHRFLLQSQGVCLRIGARAVEQRRLVEFAIRPLVAASADEIGMESCCCICSFCLSSALSEEEMDCDVTAWACEVLRSSL